MEALFQLGIVLILLLLGYFIGSRNEKRHYLSIRKREKELLHLPAVNFETLPDGKKVSSMEMVSGSTVVSVDYFKIRAGIKTLFGGRLDTYESLVDRARARGRLENEKEYQIRI